MSDEPRPPARAVHWVAPAGPGPGEDRAGVVAAPDGLVLVVADGAGGTGGGADAADAVVAGALRRAPELLAGRATPADVLATLDRQLARSGAPGQTTAVLALLDATHIRGASVGDSGTWLVTDAALHDLTAEQRRKPLLGTGEAVPVGFEHVGTAGTLLLASDGLLKYAGRDRLVVALRTIELADLPSVLVAAARLPGGALQDDVAVIVARAR